MKPSHIILLVLIGCANPGEKKNKLKAKNSPSVYNINCKERFENNADSSLALFRVCHTKYTEIQSDSLMAEFSGNKLDSLLNFQVGDNYLKFSRNHDTISVSISYLDSRSNFSFLPNEVQFINDTVFLSETINSSQIPDYSKMEFHTITYSFNSKFSKAVYFKSRSQIEIQQTLENKKKK